MPFNGRLKDWYRFLFFLGKEFCRFALPTSFWFLLDIFPWKQYFWFSWSSVSSIFFCWSCLKFEENPNCQVMTQRYGTHLNDIWLVKFILGSIWWAEPLFYLHNPLEISVIWRHHLPKWRLRFILIFQRIFQEWKSNFFAFLRYFFDLLLFFPNFLWSALTQS